MNILYIAPSDEGADLANAAQLHFPRVQLPRWSRRLPSPNIAAARRGSGSKPKRQNNDESLRSWAARSLEQFDTKPARYELWKARANDLID
jgi:hypothetical protein